MISSLRMTILCEDQARLGFLDRKFSGQHGLSIFIEAGANILLDVGPSDVTVKNAELADVNLGATDHRGAQPRPLGSHRRTARSG